jgi:prepilin-type N-terminal cleavage/methylation domain-containing protein
MLNRKGFTLIELLIVVVIIGILAAIAIPKFANTKEKAYVASMKSDLRNLVNAEEAYFADWTTYVGTFPTTLYSASPGVTVTIANPDGKRRAHRDRHQVRYRSGCRPFQSGGRHRPRRRAALQIVAVQAV